MPSNDAFRAEWQALELVTRGLADDADRRRFAALLAEPGLDATELYAQAFAHRLLPLLGHWLAEVEDAASSLPKLVRFELAQAYFRQGVQTRLLTDEAERVGDALEAAGVPIAFAKGVVLANDVYEAPGARSMNDIDIMALPSDAAKVDEVMTGLGYIVGEYSFRKRRVIPLNRKLLMQYKLYADHIPMYARATDEAVQPCFAIDFSHTFTWVGSRWQVDLESALRDASRSSERVRLPILSPIDQFLRVVLHIFREGWLEHWVVREENDITLRKFADVVRFWTRYRDELADGRLSRAVCERSVAEPTAWVLAHADAVCGTQLVAEADLGEFVDEDWLRSAAGGNEAPLRWHGDIRRRLHDRTQPAFERVAT
jgi:hypothetical protein